MKILFIRRDNIGDLVCTTPAFASLRKTFPTAYIAVLANSYSAPVLANNPDVDDVFSYTKAKHGGDGEWTLVIWIKTLYLLLKLRARRFDVAVAIGTSAVALARLIGPKRLIRAGDVTGGDVIAMSELEPLHAVEAAHRFLAPLGISSAPGPLVVHSGSAQTGRVTAKKGSVIGLQLSARKPSQRWSEGNFSALATQLQAQLGATFMVFWSPGSDANVVHPGDDEKARRFEQTSGGLNIRLYPSHQLADLVAGMSLCDLIICGDGGAMHIAAGLGKPIVALFGDSDPRRWRPWGVPCRVLQPGSRDVADLAVEDVSAAAVSLLAELAGER